MLYTDKGNSPSFKAANVNILALSDTHGQVRYCSRFYDTFLSHKNDIFTLTDNLKNKACNLNLFAIAGDWFMNPGTRGVFRTCADQSAGLLQNRFLKKLIEIMSQFAKIVCVPGNHCLSDGDTLFYDITKEDDFANIVTNIDVAASPALKNAKPGKFVNSKVIKIPDDKNPLILRKILLLGLIPPNMAYYSREAMQNTAMYDNRMKKSSEMTREDIAETINRIKKITDEFKKENPDSPVLIINHSDLNILKMICEEANIDYVLQGHVHLTKPETYRNSSGKETKIFNLSENFKHFGSLKIHFDDEGLFTDKFKLFETEEQKNSDNEFDKLYRDTFAEDIKGLVKIEGNGELLSIKGIRHKDNPISKIVADGIFSSLKQDYPDIKIFMMPTSAFRKDLTAGEYVTNNDIIDLFGGINDHDGIVKVGYLSGVEIIRYIAQNVFYNILLPERNTIPAVSGIQFNKTEIGKFLESHKITDLSLPSDETLAPLANYIKVLNDKGKYEPINLQNRYKTACPVKFFNKTNIPQFKKAGEFFEQTDKTVLRLFLEYVNRMQKSNLALKIPRDIRVID